MQTRNRALAFAVAGLLLAAGRAAAEEAPASEETAPAPGEERGARPSSATSGCTWGNGRLLGGNLLLEPSFVDSAETLTSLDVRTGAQFTRVPDLPFGRLGNLLLHRVEAAGQVNLRIRVHERVSINGSFVLLSDIGTSPQSLAITGGQYFAQGTGGFTLNVLRMESTGTLLSVLGNLGGGGGKLFNIVPLLDNLSAAPRATAEDVLGGNLRELLMTPTHSFIWNAAIAAAQAISPLFSAQLSLGLSGEAKHFEPFDSASGTRGFFTLRTLTPRLGIALAGDASPYQIPVALMLEYQISWFNVTNSSTDTTVSHIEHILAADLFYSGRSDLQVGVAGFLHLGTDPVAGRTSDGTPADSSRPTIWGLEGVVRYFW